MSHPLSPNTQTHLPFSAEELQNHIAQDVSLCTELLKLLNEEQSALKNREVDNVEMLIEKKIPLLEALENSAKQRQVWANAQAASANNEALWTSILSSLGNSKIKEQWEKLKTLYTDVRTQNEINGKLLARHQGTLQRVLDIMRGKTASPNLYNATGYSSSASHSNTFGEA